MVAPFASVFWFSAGIAFIGVVFQPFLRITTQGHKGDTGRVKESVDSALNLDDGHAVVAANEKNGQVDFGSNPKAS